ncbi:hypothetical protein [Mycobacteroides abscessus]|uniref:hypothetical protein n=1 Tax=Mycobacteroides abscessus TaxID=36809 RepID=UPI00092B98F3|nr:hypothetical protein [Mycobacteroides abscessus]SII40607.1 Uncharacterised protein [Mycobacteroides abscessus subsp. abscessus]SIK14637.1 Uncharacterised protein [Mycobacteroides abscessus subsp. abscessus]SIN25123.1 Uncharacterised protein [Mycobacteroides abscessus subsp. abscessus]SLI51823.1 Uncharacterised protein [Mycobacteroides abscessus subsp. abscessus]
MSNSPFSPDASAEAVVWYSEISKGIDQMVEDHKLIADEEHRELGCRFTSTLLNATYKSAGLKESDLIDLFVVAVDRLAQQAKEAVK